MRNTASNDHADAELTDAPRHPNAAIVRRSSWARARRLLFLALVSLLLVTWLPVLALRWYDPPVTAFMLFHNQRPLAQTQMTWRDADALGRLGALAVMAAEDQNFPRHHGLDFDAIAQAVDDTQDGGRLRGASGITQQLAKNLFLWSGRSLMRKGLEAYFAVVIDLLLPKRRILELYLNVIELGPGVYGMPAASLHFFGVDADAITPSQAALLAAVLPNPNRLSVARPSDYVRSRQAWIAEQAARLGRDGSLEAIAW